MADNRLFYRSKFGPKTRIALDFVEQFFEKTSVELQSPATQDFIHRTRIPNERELYGLLIKAITKVGGDTDIGHIATEIQIDRLEAFSESVASSTGRVDILVTYRNTVFLIEVKVARVSLGASLSSAQTDSKIIRTWNSAINQLRAIDDSKVRSMLNMDVKKLALTICLHYDGRKAEFHEGGASLVNRRHRSICDEIDTRSTHACDYEWQSTFKDPIQPYRRRSTSVDDERWLSLYGFSLFGALID